MSDLFRLVKVEIEALVADGKQAVGDGLSWSEVWTLLNRTYEAVVRIVDELEASRPEKKVLALACIDHYYAEVIAPINIPSLPDWLEETVVDKAIGMAIHQIADWAIDRIMAALDDQDWGG